MTARVEVDVRECVGVGVGVVCVGVVCVGVVCGCGVGVVWVWCGCGCGVGVVYLCHLIACWMVLDKAVGTYSI